MVAIEVWPTHLLHLSDFYSVLGTPYESVNKIKCV